MTDHIAIAHKDYDVRGGGEILAEHLARTFDCPMFIGHGDASNQPEGGDLDVREIAPDSRYHRLMERGGAPRGIAHMFHWRDNAPDELRQYDTLVLSGNEPLWYVPDDDQTVVAYTHSTPRHMYDLYNETVDGFVGRTYNMLQRRLYEGAVKRPDLFVANSDRVARRIQRYWNVPEEQVRVIYPPIETEKYSPHDSATEDYLVTVGRLSGLKHVDEIVRVCNERGLPLVVAGDGPERDWLEELAGPTVSIAGYVSEEKKQELLAGARAFVMNAENEDFGMSPVEAFAAGTPVVGVSEGFTEFQVRDGENGYLFDRGELAEAISRFDREGVAWAADQIAEFARLNFSLGAFEQGMLEAVREAERQSAIEPEFALPTGTDETATPRPAIADGGNDGAN